VRAYYGNPTSHFVFNEVLYKVFESEVVPYDCETCGKVVAYDKKQGFVISCKKDALKICKIQKQGGKVLDIKDFMNGNHFEVGQIID